MTPKAGFDAALKRATHLLRLYELVCDTRIRAAKTPWMNGFRKLMRWNAGDSILRIDGKDKRSVLIVRNPVDIDRQSFAHGYSSELLRSAVVAAVSALDRLMHDLVVKHSWKLLQRAEADVPKALRGLPVSAIDARKALEHLRKDAKARPGSLIKKAIQEKLHRDFTFQSPDAVKLAADMLGVQDFWSKVAAAMPAGPPKADVIEELRRVAVRRNQIVHEADLTRTNRRNPTLRDISFEEANRVVEWMRDFGSAVDAVVATSVQ